MAILTGVNRYLIVVLIFIFLIISSGEHFFTYLLAICMSSSSKKKVYQTFLSILHPFFCLTVTEWRCKFQLQRQSFCKNTSAFLHLKIKQYYMSVISQLFKDVKLFLKRSYKIDRSIEGSSSHLRTDQAEIDEVGFAQEFLFRNILHLYVFLMV